MLLGFSGVFRATADDSPCAATPALDTAYKQMKSAASAREVVRAQALLGDATGHSSGELQREPVCEGAFHHLMAQIFESAGQLTDARASYLKELSILNLLKQQRESATVLRLLARLGMQLGDEDGQTEDYLTRSLAISESIQDKSTWAAGLNLLGYYRMEHGRFADAEKPLLDCVAIASSIDDQPRAGKCKGSLADLYEHRAEYVKARTYGFESLDTSRRSADGRESARVLDILANVYLDLNQADRALQFYEEALGLRESLHLSQQDIAVSHQDLGDALAHLGRRGDALRHLQKALELRRAVGNPKEIASTLNAIGGVQPTAEARKSYTESLAIARKHHYDDLIAGNLYQLGDLSLDAGDLAAALADHREALKIREALHDPANEIFSRDRVGVVLERSNRLEDAAAMYESALAPLETLGKQVTDPTQYGAFLVTSEILYPHYARVLFRLGKIEQAFLISERERGVGLARAARLNARNFSDQLSPQAQAEWQGAKTALARAANNWAYLSKTGSEPRLIEDAKVSYLDGAKRLDTVRDRLLMQNPELSIEDFPPVTMTELSGLALPETLYLEWRIVDDSSVLLFAFSGKTGIQAWELPAGDAMLRSAVTAWRATLIQSNGRGVGIVGAGPATGNEPKLAADLFRTLFGPAARLLDSRAFHRLVVVPDGPLSGIPFAALIDGSGNRLLETFSITNEVSLGSLLHVPARPEPKRYMLVLGDPLHAGEKRIVEPGDSIFEPLAFARSEAEAIAGLDTGAVLRVGESARESDIKRTAGDFEILHIATHAILDANDGMQSGLLLATEPRDSAEDGFLQAWEIAGLSLSARLTVLSACQTGEGAERIGEGLLGLSWAFQAAGCPTVVGSLWAVDDASTSELMVAFYKELKAGTSADEALRRAAVALRANPRFSSPSYWAPFIVTGQPDSKLRNSSAARAQ